MTNCSGRGWINYTGCRISRFVVGLVDTNGYLLWRKTWKTILVSLSVSKWFTWSEARLNTSHFVLILITSPTLGRRRQDPHITVMSRSRWLTG